MTHFATIVLVDRPIDRGQAESAVTPLLAPYDENGEWFAEGSRWDWWQVGGRYTGFLDPDYDPLEDERNHETCGLCGGTGTRPDGIERFGEEWAESCNGCHGTGRAKSSLVEHAGDVRPVASLPEDCLPAAVVTPDGQWHEQGRIGWFATTLPDEEGNEPKSEGDWSAAVRALLEQHPEASAVVVDCHV